ncbi:LOW QUALITY PROTEIN: hypothetical protein ACHAWF_004740 [Thalassiosira exigua]
MHCLKTCKGGQSLLACAMSTYSCIHLIQNKRQWCPYQATNIYDLPWAKQGTRWMHACSFPVKTTGLKAIKTRNFHSWPLLTEHNVQKCYPDMTATPKGHLNQARNNRALDQKRSCKLSRRSRTADCRDKRCTTCTPLFRRYLPSTSKAAASSLSPIKLKSCKTHSGVHIDHDEPAPTTNIVPKKHVFDNGLSNELKELIREKYKMEIELVSLGTTAEVAVRNGKAHFLSVLAGVVDDSPLQLLDWLLPQVEIALNILQESNATPKISAYVHRYPLRHLDTVSRFRREQKSAGAGLLIALMADHLPEHYCTHLCYVKSTCIKQLSNSVHFYHQNITQSMLTAPPDKLIKAIAICTAALKQTGTSLKGQKPRNINMKCILDATMAMISIDGLCAQDDDKRQQQIQRAPSMPPTPDND